MDKEKELDNILDECLDRLIFEGATVEQCLSDYPQYADELKPLLETSLQTSRISSLEPNPEFKTKARNELFAALRDTEEKRSRSLFNFGWQPRWAGAVAVFVALLIATGGTAAASTGSMPNDFLYPVKRATEQVQLAFTFTNLGKAEAYARMANRRVEEIIYMANENETGEIELLASNLDSNLNNIAVYSAKSNSQATSTESGGAIQFSKRAATTEEAYESADTGEGLMAAEAPDVDEAAAEEEPAPSPAAAAEPVPSLQEASTQNETGTFSTDYNVETPPTVIAEPESTGHALSKKAELNITVINQANSNIQRLYDLLETAPESARAAIEKAIEISERGYEIAIESLE